MRYYCSLFLLFILFRAFTLFILFNKTKKNTFSEKWINHLVQWWITAIIKNFSSAFMSEVLEIQLFSSPTSRILQVELELEWRLFSDASSVPFTLHPLFIFILCFLSRFSTIKEQENKMKRKLGLKKRDSNPQSKKHLKEVASGVLQKLMVWKGRNKKTSPHLF